MKNELFLETVNSERINGKSPGTLKVIAIDEVGRFICAYRPRGWNSIYQDKWREGTLYKAVIWPDLMEVISFIADHPPIQTPGIYDYRCGPYDEENYFEVVDLDSNKKIRCFYCDPETGVIGRYLKDENGNPIQAGSVYRHNRVDESDLLHLIHVWEIRNVKVITYGDVK